MEEGLSNPERLVDIVPEYHSRNPLVRWLFRSRLELALKFGELDVAAPLDVLDLGCGEGAFALAARASFPQHHYVGWDMHPEIESLHVPGVKFARVDVTRMAELPACTFDRVFCLDVLEHFPRLDGVLAAVRSLLKPDGRLVISEPTESLLYKLGRLAVKGTMSANEGPAAGPHYHDAQGVDREVLKAGFQRTALRKIPPFPLFTLFHITCYRATC